MKVYSIFSVLAIAVTVSACGQSAPKCSDQATTDLVKEISRDELVSQLGQEVSDSIKLKVEAIRTTDFNEKVGSQECAAQLTMSGPGGSESLDITYTSEKTDDGEEFYVTVFGL